MEKGLLHFGGIPTAPDVLKLRDKFGVPQVGTIISYEEIESTISDKRRTCRFHSVVEAWRKTMEREHNVIFGCIASKGLQVLDSLGRVTMASVKQKRGIRSILRGVTVADTTSPVGLTVESLRTRDHLVRVGKALRDHAAKEAKQLNAINSEEDSKKA